MLIQADSSLLGDKHVKDKEAVAKLKEEHEARRKELGHHLRDQVVYADQTAALGTPLSWVELVRRIKLLNPAIIVEDGGYPNAVAVRIMRDNGDGEGVVKSYITGFMKEILPEFSSVTLDKDGVAEHEKRGWRTVLKMLIRQRVVRYTDVVKHFGPLDGRQHAGLWERDVREHKN